MMHKLGAAGDRFGDCLCMDYANLPYVSGRNQFTNTKFTRPYNQVLKSNDAGEEGCYAFLSSRRSFRLRFRLLTQKHEKNRERRMEV